jgi:enediyne polyketide synthase
MDSIAIVGMACRYPDARSPRELWENALAQRRAFRRMPDERLRLADYFSADRAAPDRTYSTCAAVIEGYEFDRVRFRVSGPTFRSVDLTHWLALDMAAQALADAGYPDADGLPRESTGVFVGNTLAGEFSRANVMRLRWPYVRRVVESVLPEIDLQALEVQYKSAFPPVGEETLAGGMSNTIAGRICNYFDLKGGGYTVDGACASSLLSIANACAALQSGELDVAIAGGVDLSLDPFELIGFAKAGALAEEKMRVFDARSAGFWPGEGCGIVVLMRTTEAVHWKRPVYAVIRGWGVSSDGSGGLTRPEADGQILALRRAYSRAGFDIDTVGYFEAHGTGTAVGDTTELSALNRARRQDGSPAVLSTIKANIGHTKAAAGVAGLIKAAMAVHEGVLPPVTGCDNPHPDLRSSTALRVLRRGQPWQQENRRAGISAMGFGGINAHIVLEGATSSTSGQIPAPAQDCELFLFAAEDRDKLLTQVEQVSSYAAKLSEAELTDLAAALAGNLGTGPYRAAVVAGGPQELAARLDQVDPQPHQDSPRIGFLFPGQASPPHLTGGVWRDRFDNVADLYDGLHFPDETDTRSTAIAQPAILRATLTGLRVLDRFGVTASAAVGHSLGEIAALHWAGAMDEQCLLRIVAGRASAMSGLNGGAMASIGTGKAPLLELLNGHPVVIAGLNSPSQTVISGESQAVAAVVARARANGAEAVTLPVSHAFHSQLVAGATPILAEVLERERFLPLQRKVISTVTGSLLAAHTDLRELLCSQVTKPVRFLEAVVAASSEVDLWIEVGPGSVLAGLVKPTARVPVISLDAGGSSLEGLLKAVGEAFVLGADIRYRELFEGRVIRPFDLNWHPKFFANPCESAPILDVPVGQVPDLPSSAPVAPGRSGTCPTEVLRELVAHRSELPLSGVKESFRFLSDLHLNSIVVGQIVAEASRRLGVLPPVAPTQYADARISEVAQALEEIARVGIDPSKSNAQRIPPGVDSWVRCFQVKLVEQPLNPASQSAPGSSVVVSLPAHPDERHIRLLLAAAAQARSRDGNRFVIVEHGGGGGAFARSLHLESPEIVCCVVAVPDGHPEAPHWAASEASAATGYTEAHYDEAGVRHAPVMELVQWQEAPILPASLGPDDVLLVTGGGKGIAAECALDLARTTNVRLALVGRSHPETDLDLKANLERLAALGVTFRYISADVSDSESIRTAIQQAEAALGPITAVLHGAAANVPQLIGALDAEAFTRTLLPKVTGLENVLAAVNPDRLRLLVSFGSLIARTGLRGEAHYGVANEWLRVMVERWKQQHQSCRCLHLEWSVWSGAGMGERLGRLDLLMQQGITPIPMEDGLRILRQLLKRDLPATSLVVTGRFGDPPALSFHRAELPFLRFLEKIRTYVPGVELIAEAELSLESDPYLNDHIFDGQRLLPGVMGLEAMAQVAGPLLESNAPLSFEDVVFRQPIVIPESRAIKIRIAALADASDRCRVVIRSAETGFQVDHFQATCRAGAVAQRGRPQKRLVPGAVTVERPFKAAMSAFKRAFFELRIQPQTEPRLVARPSGSGLLEAQNRRGANACASDLYGTILFQSGRFRRVRGYRRLRAKECVAEIAPASSSEWFWRYLPGDLKLGDPGARDASIHAIQAGIPHAALLPTGVERIVTFHLPDSSPLFVHARERENTSDTFVYDLDIVDGNDNVVEQWRGLQLQRVRDVDITGFAAPLLGPYLERRIADLMPEWNAAVVVEQNNDSEMTIHRALATFEPILRRPDGKPEVAREGWHVSASHCGDLVVVAAGEAQIACDAEEVVERSPDIWKSLLGEDGFTLAKLIATRISASFDSAATRVWTARECLTKAGAGPGSPLVLERCSANGAVSLTSGSYRIATLEVLQEPVRIFAFLACEPTNFATS